MKKKIKSGKIILLTVGIILTVNAVVMFFTSNFNIGLLFALLLGLSFVLYGAFLDRAREKLPAWLKTVYFGGVSVLLVFVMFLLSYGLSDNVSGREDAIIVLGSGIRGELLTQGLKNRLDAAIDCYEENEDLLIVVSGGQGPQEDITEALAMERYLLARGVPQESIIKEEQATSTYENFIYSKKILDEKLGDGYTAAFVSNEYHIYRASSLARIAGFDTVTHTHSSTMWYTLVPSTLRETLAVVKLWVFKN
ncbi:MAG: YdcF family protein [Clostridia bacterium]|nr:YdcF family protein [Clostridia bacterium]